jgi:cytochrome c biogenesis protein CcmG, thiol:disulfide interchange protein DsbE
MKKISLLTLLVCCSLLFLVACGQETELVKIGKPAPDFTLVDRQGKTWTLSELKGQVVFLNFWATWCAPCREEMPDMQKLYEKMPKDKFKMLAILNNDDPTLADKFAEKLGLTMPILDDQANTVGMKYGLTGVPETFIINKKGQVVRKYIGSEPWSSQGFKQMFKQFMDQ